MIRTFTIIAALLISGAAIAQSTGSKLPADTPKTLLQPSPKTTADSLLFKRKKTDLVVRPAFAVQEISGEHAPLSSPPVNGRKIRAGAAPFPPALSFPSIDSLPSQTVYDRVSGLPLLINRPSGPLLAGPTARTSIAAASYNFLSQVKTDLQIQQPNDEFVIRSVETDRRGQRHVRMQQQYRGVRVYGSEVVLHTEQNQLRKLTGRYQATPTYLSVDAAVSQSQAIASAVAAVKKETTFRELKPTEKSMLAYEQPKAELVIYPAGQASSPTLAWHVTVRPNFVERWEYFVDAQQGTVVDFYNHTCHVDGPGISTANDLWGTPRSIHTYEADGFDYLIDTSRPMFDAAQSSIPDNPVGAIVTLDARNSPYTDVDLYYVRTQNDQWDPTAVSAHHNASLAYEYYTTTHKRNSIDGRGGRVLSIVNVADEDGADFGNAAWNGAAMLYGNGDDAFLPLARSLDVAGHEMTHGVINSTANLEYRDESGAINESMADVFGILIEREAGDWQLGEDVVRREVYASGALRDMADPHNGGTRVGDPGFQPKHVNEQYTGSQDNGGVHVNSGILNHAFYLFATNQNVGLEKAERTYYHALTNYLTAFSQFIDLRIAVIQSVADLYGANGAEVAAAEAAFDAVGIEDGEGTEQRPDLPTATGDEFILSYDVNPDDENTLYLSDTNGDNFVPKSTTVIKRKPSVTDDGSAVVFVSEDSQIRTLSLVGEPNERLLQDQTIWDNAAVSKDGTRIAAITTAQDTSVYVYDFETQEWAKFQLYNPSYTEGVTTGEVLYADALEWDYSGEFLIYDAFNRFSSPEGSDLEYWDVGLIKVWDNETDTFGDGTINKLFNSLPEGVSIGNPSFSTNSPTIVAFDYANFEEEEYRLLTANIATGTVKEVFTNSKIGYPNYSVADDKLVFDALDQDGEDVVAVIDLAEDKISPADSSAFVLIPDARWAVWFSQGERAILSSANELLTFGFEEFDPTITGVIDGQSVVITVPGNTDLTRLVASFTHAALSEVKVGEQEQTSGVTANDFSQLVTYTVVAEDGSTQDYSVEVRRDQTTQLSDAKEILTFALEGLAPPALGTISEDSIVVVVPEDTDLSSLVATFTHSEAARIRVGLVGQRSGTSVNDFTQPVIYTVTAEDRTSRDYTVVTRVDRATGLADEQTQRAITVYPNPAATQLSIASEKLPAHPTQVVIFNALGRVVQRQSLSSSPGGSSHTAVTVAHLAPGVYSAKIVLDNTFVVKRFIKE